jgi:hypothetical protein
MRSLGRYTERAVLHSLDRYTEGIALCSLDRYTEGVALCSLDRYTEGAALCSWGRCIAVLASPLLDRSILRKPSLRSVAARSWPKESFAPGSRRNEGRVISHDFPAIRELPENCRIG